VTAGVYPDAERPMYFVGIDNARFRRPVEPGDQIILKATLERSMRGIWKFATVAEVADEEAASATMMVAPGTAAKAAK
jgi:3-hydroxyacyl-[acyl-carrier-protein] dehydratase